MNEKRSNDANPYVSDHEFLEGLHRTREGLHGLDGVDLDELTRQGYEAYWRSRAAQEPVVDVRQAELATAQLARRYMSRSGLAVSSWAVTIAISTVVVVWTVICQFLRSLRRPAKKEEESAEVVM